MLKYLLFFQLVYVVNQVHFPWETGIPGVAPTNILFALILLAMRGQVDQIDTRGMLRRPLMYFFTMLTLAFVWAEIISFNDLLADLTYLKNALFFPLYYFLYLKCKQDQKTTRQLIVMVMVVAAVAGLEAFREGLDYGFGHYAYARRASGPFGVDWRNSNRAGVFFGMFMPMFVALALFLKRQKLWRFAALGAIVVIAGGTLATYSRQSYILVLLSTVLLLVRKNIILAVIIGVTLVSMVGYLPDSVFQRVEETKQTGSHGEEEVDVSTASRWEIWGGAMGMLRDYPMGAGLFRFRNHIGDYVGRYKNMDAHNFYVLTLAECGPQGLIAWLFVILTLFRLAKFLRANAAPDDPEARALSIGFTVSTICMALGEVYGSPTFEGAVMAPYWAMAGLLERYFLLKMQGQHRDDEKTDDETDDEALVKRFPLAAYRHPGRP